MGGNFFINYLLYSELNICCLCVRSLRELGGRVGVFYLFLICCICFICVRSLGELGGRVGVFLFAVFAVSVHYRLLTVLCELGPIFALFCIKYLVRSLGDVFIWESL